MINHFHLLLGWTKKNKKQIHKVHNFNCYLQLSTCSNQIQTQLTPQKLKQTTNYFLVIYTYFYKRMNLFFLRLCFFSKLGRKNDKEAANFTTYKVDGKLTFIRFCSCILTRGLINAEYVLRWSHHWTQPSSSSENKIIIIIRKWNHQHHRIIEGELSLA